MPKIKTVRDELVIYKPEWIETLENAKLQYAPYLSAWLAFNCIFGKRRNEICRLKRKDVWVEGQYLYCHFFVGKKRNRTATIDKMPYTKKISLKHYAVPYILEYLQEWDDWFAKPKPRKVFDWGLRNDYLFPSRRKSSELTVHTKCRLRDGSFETREYTYHVEGGYMSGADIYNKVKRVNSRIWPHLGRHSVATKAAEDGATEYDIANILDVTPRTGSKYVHHGTKLTEKWSDQVE